MKKLKDKEIVFSETFIIPKNESVSFDVSLPKIELTFNINFTEESEGNEPKVTWDATTSNIRITFHKWNNTLGTALIEPIKLGWFENTSLGFIASHQKIGNTDLLHFQVLFGGVYEEK